MNCFKKIALITVLLSLSSCGWRPIASVRFYNEMSVPVNVSYMYLMGYGLDQSNDLHDMDTVYHTINPGKGLKLKFCGWNAKDFVKDSSYFGFLKLETPTKSVCYKGSDEIWDFFFPYRPVKSNLWDVSHSKVFITDSLFNSKK